MCVRPVSASWRACQCASMLVVRQYASGAQPFCLTRARTPLPEVYLRRRAGAWWRMRHGRRVLISMMVVVVVVLLLLLGRCGSL